MIINLKTTSKTIKWQLLSGNLKLRRKTVKVNLKKDGWCLAIYLHIEKRVIVNESTVQMCKYPM